MSQAASRGRADLRGQPDLLRQRWDCALFTGTTLALLTHKKSAVMFVVWVFFLISPAHLHVRRMHVRRMGRTCR